MSSFKGFMLSERKAIWTNIFKGIPYVHMKDRSKDKTLSFSLDEFQALFKKQKKLLAYIESSLEKQKKTNKKSKKRKYDDSDSSEDEKRKSKKNKMKYDDSDSSEDDKKSKKKKKARRDESSDDEFSSDVD